jgi:hypothetical protein
MYAAAEVERRATRRRQQLEERRQVQLLVRAVVTGRAREARPDLRVLV